MPVNIGELTSEVVPEPESSPPAASVGEDRMWVELRRHRRNERRREQEESRTRARGFDD